MAIDEALVNQLKTIIETWKKKAESDPRSYGPAGVLAFQIAEAIEKRLDIDRKTYYQLGLEDGRAEHLDPVGR